MCHNDQSGCCMENRQWEGEGRDWGTNAEAPPSRRRKSGWIEMGEDVHVGMAVKLRGPAHGLDKGDEGEGGVKRDSWAQPDLGDGAVLCDGQHRADEESIPLSRAPGV